MAQISEGSVYESLLGRPARQLLSQAERDAFAGQRVLITGAGGSIGSEIANELAACHPARLVLFEQCEYNLFRIEQQLAEKFPGLRLEAVLGDVRRIRHIRHACNEFHPDVVYHAAAYKHVTMTERAVCAAVETNVFGTLNVARMAAESGARFVLISSDKAVRPRSIMGATKRLAEMVTATTGSIKSCSLVVRFGNVLGSSGSVVDIFFDCLRTGKTMKITDPDATRYFMTAKEAACLILNADCHGRPGNVYWLDMGGQVRLGNLIERLQALVSSQGLGRVPLKMTGLRAGEKLHEDLMTEAQDAAPTAQPHIYVARQVQYDSRRLQQIVMKLAASVAAGDAVQAIAALCEAVPEYKPSDQARFAAAAATLSMPRDARVFEDAVHRQQATCRNRPARIA